MTPVERTAPQPVTEPPEPTLGTLVSQLSQQVPQLVRAELRLAQAEVAEKGKRAGLGIGMFSAAGLLAFFGIGALVTTSILLLALVLPAWAASLVVTVLLLLAAGGVALAGRNSLAEAAPLTPERAVAGLKEDVATLKRDRDQHDVPAASAEHAASSGAGA